MGIFDWLGSNRTRNLIVNQINAMLGPQDRRPQAAIVLGANPYLYGYVMGRIGIIMHMTSRLTPERQEKLLGAVISQLFPGGVGLIVKSAFDRAINTDEYSRGVSDAQRVGSYFYGAAYSSDPDVPKALDCWRKQHELARQFGVRINNDQRSNVVGGMDYLYFGFPFWKEMEKRRGE